jgi:GAF domain-containing protein
MDFCERSKPVHETKFFGINAINFEHIMLKNLPSSIDKVFVKLKKSELIFSALMPALGKFLNCDRCFLYLRDPQTCLGRVAFCWVRSDIIPMVYDESWKHESKSLIIEDPMFAAALQTEPSIFIEDVEATDAKILSQSFEKKSFGHRALIHAHLCQDNQLWGILQPCVFTDARSWTQEERQVMNQITQIITPIAVEYVTVAKKK